MFSQFNVLKYFLNSFLVAISVVVFVTILGVLAAYGFPSSASAAAPGFISQWC